MNLLKLVGCFPKSSFLASRRKVTLKGLSVSEQCQTIRNVLPRMALGSASKAVASSVAAPGSGSNTRFVKWAILGIVTSAVGYWVLRQYRYVCNCDLTEPVAVKFKDQAFKLGFHLKNVGY